MHSSSYEGKVLIPEVEQFDLAEYTKRILDYHSVTDVGIDELVGYWTGFEMEINSVKKCYYTAWTITFPNVDIDTKTFAAPSMRGVRGTDQPNNNYALVSNYGLRQLIKYYVTDPDRFTLPKLLAK